MFSRITELSTLAISPLGLTEKLYPHLFVKRKNQYRVLLNNENGITLGGMNFEVKYSPDKHIYIDFMDNKSCHKYVGKALHEFAFRCCEEIKAEGGIRLRTAYGSDYFHFKNGYILDDEYNISTFIDYYLLLAKAIMDAKGKRVEGRFGSFKLSLPASTIQEKRIEFGFSKNSIVLDEGDKKECISQIISGAERNSFYIKTLIEINNSIGYKILNPLTNNKGFKFSIDDKLHPGLGCIKTKNIMQKAVRSIITKLPIDNAIKEKEFDIIVVGALIYAMAYQDKTYGKQADFNHEFLYAHTTLDKLLNITEITGDTTTNEIIRRFGQAALIDHTIPFDGKIASHVFPGLCGIPELEKRFASYQPVVAMREKNYIVAKYEGTLFQRIKKAYEEQFVESKKLNKRN